MKRKPAHILLVEDNEGDIELTKVAFERGNLSSHLSVPHDGVEALAYLRKEGTFADAGQPSLILLDLNMPRMDGKEFLGVVKQDEQLKPIPVVVFTSSSAPQDIAQSYRLHANAYIIKPFRTEDYIEVVRQLESFWGGLSQLPDMAQGQ